jgi:hypothetical protein
MLRNAYRHASVAQRISGGGALRLLSSQVPPSTSSSNKDYVKERVQYKSDLSKLRKQWADEHKSKLEERAVEERMERRKIVLQRAVKLRERRQETARNLETQRKLREEQHRKYKENLARTHILWEESRAKLNRQRQAAMKDLTEESENWITPENKHLYITPEFFTRHPTTTGIVTPFSDYWRYEVFVPSLKRLMSDHFVDKLQKTSNEEMISRHQGQVRVAKRVVVESFLNSVIDNPEDRAQFKTLVARTTRQLDVTGAFDELDAEYEREDERDELEGKDESEVLDYEEEGDENDIEDEDDYEEEDDFDEDDDEGDDVDGEEEDENEELELAGGELEFSEEDIDAAIDEMIASGEMADWEKKLAELEGDEGTEGEENVAEGDNKDADEDDKKSRSHNTSKKSNTNRKT